MFRKLTSIFLAFLYLFTGAIVQAQSDPAWEVIRLVNGLRTSRGLPPYQVDSVLMQVAQAQASWCAANNHIGHDGPGGSFPNDRAQAAGYGGEYGSFATENQSHGTAGWHTPELVVTMWQGDWGHLNAMISADYEHIGVGFAEANGFSWYILMAGWVADGTSSVKGEGQAVQVPTLPNAVPVVLSEPNAEGATYHEVQPGQAAWTIAASYGIELGESYKLNGLADDSILQPGDQLLIRPSDPPLLTEAVQPQVTEPVPLPSSTPIPSPTAVEPLELAVLPDPTIPVSPDRTEDAELETTSGSTMLPIFLGIGGSVLLLLLFFSVIKTKRR